MSRFKQQQQLVSEAWPRSSAGTLPPRHLLPGSALHSPSLSSSSDLRSARMGTAALQHDNGALLIIQDSVLAQVMMAKMYLPPSSLPSHETGTSGIQACSLRGTVIIDHIVEACSQYKGHVGEQCCFKPRLAQWSGHVYISEITNSYY